MQQKKRVPLLSFLDLNGDSFILEMIFCLTNTKNGCLEFTIKGTDWKN